VTPILTPPYSSDLSSWAESFAENIASVSYNNTIKDTISLPPTIPFETIERRGKEYYAIDWQVVPQHRKL
ncbi:MAG: hypothetical protein HUJ96_06970, partial [Marinilabiliaceae bacterium]|nr:hypothetical protein [Marinilabiliaceae bacterium]